MRPSVGRRPAAVGSGSRENAPAREIIGWARMVAEDFLSRGDHGDPGVPPDGLEKVTWWAFV